MKVAPGNADVSRSGDFRCHRCFDATPRDALRVGQLAQPSRFHLRHFDDFSLGVVDGPLGYLFAVFKIPRPHLGTVFPEPLSISGQHVIDGMAPGLDGSFLVTFDAFLDQGILARMVGIGDLTISTAATVDPDEVIEGIPNPKAVRELILAQRQGQ